MQWLKLPARKVGDREFEPHSGLQVSKKQKFSIPHTHSILWEPQEVLLLKFSLYVYKGGIKHQSFHFISSHYCLTSSRNIV